jgi:transcriptional regulator with XRE-family HTH domain
MNATSRLDTLRNMLDMSMRQAALGAAIRQARREKGWKQRQLAAQIPGRDGPVDTQTVSRWERGEHVPDLDTLEIVAQVLGKPLSYFVAEEDEEVMPTASDLLAAARAKIQAAERLEDAADALLKAAEAFHASAPPVRAGRRRAG